MENLIEFFAGVAPAWLVALIAVVQVGTSIRSIIDGAKWLKRNIRLAYIFIENFVVSRLRALGFVQKKRSPKMNLIA